MTYAQYRWSTWGPSEAPAPYVADTLEWCQQEKIPASLLLERLQREVEVQARALADVRQITEVLQRSVMDGGALHPEAARP